VRDVRDEAAQAFADSLRSEEAAEGRDAFHARRLPRWAS
jgi:1,4-dihydroxy-2-naphthoyl-CoA synthase